jgi:hypothetical protein
MSGLPAVSESEGCALAVVDPQFKAHGGHVDRDLQRVAFLSRVTGLPRPICAAWCYLQWIDAAERGQEPGWWHREAYAVALLIAKRVPHKRQRNPAA